MPSSLLDEVSRCHPTYLLQHDPTNHAIRFSFTTMPIVTAYRTILCHPIISLIRFTTISAHPVGGVLFAQVVRTTIWTTLIHSPNGNTRSSKFLLAPVLA